MIVSCGNVVALSLSERKGTRKENRSHVTLVENWGVEGDAHAGNWHRQVSLLAMESIQKIRARGLDVHPGAFAENITTSGIDLASLPLGTVLRIGEAILEVTQIGKECHARCAIYYQAGDCVMPREGVFARVLRGATITVLDPVRTDMSPALFVTHAGARNA